MKKDHPFLQEQLERVKRVNEGLRGEVLSFYNVYAPFSSIRFGSSDELVMAHIRENPAAVLQAMEVIAENNSLLTEMVIKEGGCNGIYYCLQGGEADRFSHEEYRTLITPSDRMVLDFANSLSENNILHCCGWAGIKNRMENWTDYPAKCVNWAIYIEGLPLWEGKKLFGGRAVLGGFDNRPGGILYQGTRQQVEAACEELIANTGHTGVLFGADCTLPADVDITRIRWVTDKAKTF